MYSPLGLLAPGFKEMGGHMTKMVQELESAYLFPSVSLGSIILRIQSSS